MSDYYEDDLPLCAECGADTEAKGVFKVKWKGKTIRVCGRCLPLFQ